MSRASRMSKFLKRPPAPPPTESSKFNVKTLEALAKDLKDRRLPVPRITISDNIVRGLRAIIRETGLISYHVYYTVGDDSPYLKIGCHEPGNPEHLTIAEAREVATTVKELGKKGIDVQEGLHSRLIREIRDQGLKWKP